MECFLVYLGGKCFFYHNRHVCTKIITFQKEIYKEARRELFSSPMTLHLHSQRIVFAFSERINYGKVGRGKERGGKR
jgi:hypothetical protein